MIEKIIGKLKEENNSCVGDLINLREKLKLEGKFFEVRGINLALRYINESNFKSAIDILNNYIDIEEEKNTKKRINKNEK